MIITRTPFRVSFAGGGTDLEEFYRNEPGAVVSTAIKKYIYVTVNKRFDHTIRVSYSKTEIVSHVNEIQHPIVREALKLVGIEGGIEIVSIADIPSGTGLGSSSSFTVGLLNALYAYKGILKPAEELAREACKIEIEILGEPIGKQDQYIAAHGGLCYFQFNGDGSVFVTPLGFYGNLKSKLNQHLLLFYTGTTRSASNILSEQKLNSRKEDKVNNLRKMRDLALDMKSNLLNGSRLSDFGQTLHRGWLLKKELASGVSSAVLDSYYEKALAAGATGGKILGAGGGGFFLFYCPLQKRRAVRQALGDLEEMDFAFELEGSKIIYVI